MYALNDNSKMLYGKHIGTILQNLPAAYLLWLRDEFIKNGIGSNSKFSEFNTALKAYIEDNLDALNLEMGKGRTGRR